MLIATLVWLFGLQCFALYFKVALYNGTRNDKLLVFLLLVSIVPRVFEIIFLLLYHSNEFPVWDKGFILISLGTLLVINGVAYTVVTKRDPFIDASIIVNLGLLIFVGSNI